jgi:FkbM family methyltransferase
MIQATTIRSVTIMNTGRPKFWKDVAAGLWEPQTFDVLDEYLGNGTFYDIGAWNGILSLYAAKKGVKTIAFEPDKVAYNEFLNNRTLNPDISGLIAIIPKAVSHKAGKLYLSNIDQLGNSMSTLVAHYGVGGESQVVDVVAIEEIFTEKPSLIKIDIEGAEFALLEKSIDVLKAQNCPIYVSIHPHFGIPFNMDLVYDNFNVNHSRSAVRNCFKHTQGIELLLT